MENPPFNSCNACVVNSDSRLTDHLKGRGDVADRYVHFDADDRRALGDREARRRTGVRRDILPPPAPEFKGKIGTTYKDSAPDFGPAVPLAAPAGAPNVLVIVLDDVGLRSALVLRRPYSHA